jgi:hypothetical protein
MPEHWAFTAYLKLMGGSVNAIDFFTVDGMNAYIAGWEKLLRSHVPQFQTRAQKIGITSADYFVTWIQSGFLAVPFAGVISLRIFDQLVAFGPRVLFSVGLMIIKTLMPQLIKSDKENMLELLRNPMRDRAFTNCRDVLLAISKLKVTAADFKRMVKVTNRPVRKSSPTN